MLIYLQVDGLLSPKKSILYLQFLDYMPCHITWTTTHSSFPPSPRHFSHDISWFMLLVFTTAFSTRQAHAHTRVPSKHAEQLQLQIHWRSAYKRRNAACPMCYKDWERQGKKNNGTLQMWTYCSCGSRQDLIWHAKWTQGNGSEDNARRNQGGIY